MKKILLYVFILVVSVEVSLQIMAAGMQFYVKRAQKSNNEGKALYRILCIGESTTAMGGEDSYPSLLEKKLNELTGSDYFQVINGGISGTTTKVIGKKIPKMISEFQPDIAIVMTGINDYWSLPDNKPESWEVWLENLSHYFRTFKLLNLIHTNKKFADFESKKSFGTCNKLDSSVTAVPSFFNDYVGQSYAINDSEGSEKAITFLRSKLPFLKNNGFCEDALPLYEQIINLQADKMNRPELALSTVNEVLDSDIEPIRRSVFIRWRDLLRQRMGLPYDDRIFPTAANYWTNSHYKLNFQNIVGLFQKSDIPVIVMQYPQLSIEPLKKVLMNHNGVTFVENKENFTRALKTQSFDDLFTDSFGKVFGHTTHDGAQVIADNVAAKVLEIIPVQK